MSGEASMPSAVMIDINAIAAAAGLWLSRIPEIMHAENRKPF
jgi:hypothetical protein